MQLSANPRARRIGRVLALVSLITGALGLAVPAHTASQNTAGRETRDQHVVMTVFDRSDATVTDLTIKDITVKEDGVAREISRVGRATGPMQIALLADDSQAAMAMPAELQRGLTSFIDLILKNNPDSEISLVTFGERPTVQAPFTQSSAILKQAASKVFPRSGSGAYLLEAIMEQTKALRTKKATNPVIVAFVVEDGPEFSNETRETVSKALQNAGVSLWTIALQGRQGDSNAQRERAAVINDVAQASGGGNKMVLDRQNLERGFTAVAGWLTSQIEVTYRRPDRLVPPSRLEVSVKRPDLRVWAPKWTVTR